MEIGILSLSDIQTNPDTGRPFPAVQRLDEITGYATLADRLGLDVFGLGEHHTSRCHLPPSHSPPSRTPPPASD